MRVNGLWRFLVVAAAATALATQTSGVETNQVSTNGGMRILARQATDMEPVSRALKHKKSASKEQEEAKETEEEEEEMVAEGKWTEEGSSSDPIADEEEEEMKEADEHEKAIEAEEEAEEKAAEKTDKNDGSASTSGKKKKKKKSKTPAPAPSEEEDEGEEEGEEATPAPTQEEEEEEEEEEETKSKKKKKSNSAKNDEDDGEDKKSSKGEDLSEERIHGDKKEGVIDHSAEGSAEIDKIDLRNEEEWVSVYDNPPIIVIKASLYAFIAYNDTSVCDSFNMTLDVVEQKPNENTSFSYHVVADVDCELNGEDQTKGRFVLNFEPEGKRLLLTECGHREEGEILNWLWIKAEVPECMTPAQRRGFLSQPIKHVHAANETSSGNMEATKTDFFARLEEGDTKEVAIAGSATVALIAVVVVLVVFVMRKRRAQKELERTIAGAKAEHADDDDDDDDDDKDDNDDDKVEKGTRSSKSKEDEGSFVNSPAVRV